MKIVLKINNPLTRIKDIRSFKDIYFEKINLEKAHFWKNNLPEEVQFV